MTTAPKHPKTPPWTRRNTATCVVAGLLLGTAALTSLVQAKGDEVVRSPSGISYVTGGTGTEAIDRLKTMESEFNLKAVFATAKGEYLSDVKVTIVDAGGREVLVTTTEGPVLMAKLAAGAYQIDANSGGRIEHRKVTLDAKRLSTVDFRWPAAG